MELQTAERVEHTEEVGDEPPLQIEPRRPPPIPVHDELLTEVGERRPRDVIGHTSFPVVGAVASTIDASTKIQKQRPRRSSARGSEGHSTKASPSPMCGTSRAWHRSRSHQQLDVASGIGPDAEHRLDVDLGHPEPHQQLGSRFTARQRERWQRLDLVERTQPGVVARSEPECLGHRVYVHSASLTAPGVLGRDDRKIDG